MSRTSKKSNGLYSPWIDNSLGRAPAGDTMSEQLVISSFLFLSSSL
jgi:hypothetical protein